MQITRFVIADIGLELSSQDDLPLMAVLPNFENFYVENFPQDIAVIRFELVEEEFVIVEQDYKLLSDISIVWGDNFKFMESVNSYVTVVDELVRADDTLWVMESDKTFMSSKIYFDRKKMESSTALSWLMMVAFGQASLRYDTALIHASVVIRDDQAVAFLGKSGTGKSTHSRLWVKHIPGFSLLNDDNPAIRVVDEENVVIYGTPWSGKTHCYVNKKASLISLVRLQQAPYNRFTSKKGKDALMELLPSFTALRWNKEIFSTMINLLENIINAVHVGHLDCLPDQDAAELCYENIK